MVIGWNNERSIVLMPEGTCIYTLKIYLFLLSLWPQFINSHAGLQHQEVLFTDYGLDKFFPIVISNIYWYISVFYCTLMLPTLESHYGCAINNIWLRYVYLYGYFGNSVFIIPYLLPLLYLSMLINCVLTLLLFMWLRKQSARMSSCLMLLPSVLHM